MPLEPGHHSVLHPAAPQAGHIEWLYWLIFWVLFSVFVLMIAAFARAGAKARVRGDRAFPIIEDEEGDRRQGTVLFLLRHRLVLSTACTDFTSL